MTKPIELKHEADSTQFYTGDSWVSRDGLHWFRADSDEGKAIKAEWSSHPGSRFVVTEVDEERGSITIDTCEEDE